MPVTSGLLPLLAAQTELDVIANHFPPGKGSLQLAGPQATRADVLAALGSHSWVHLACHARQEQAARSHSGFVLWDGTLTMTTAPPSPPSDGTWRSCPPARPPPAASASTRQFTSLPPCSSSATGTSSPPCGYQPTTARPYVANCVYTELTRDGIQTPHGAAEALHHSSVPCTERPHGQPMCYGPPTSTSVTDTARTHVMQIQAPVCRRAMRLAPFFTHSAPSGQSYW